MGQNVGVKTFRWAVHLDRKGLTSPKQPKKGNQAQINTEHL